MKIWLFVCLFLLSCTPLNFKATVTDETLQQINQKSSICLTAKDIPPYVLHYACSYGDESDCHIIVESDGGEAWRDALIQTEKRNCLLRTNSGL